MDDLIYSFLLQSDYPRASIVFDVDLLGPSVQVGSGMKVPTFVIVDPDTADPLAVIQVADALDADSLKQVAIETGAYASRLAGKLIQGFVIRVDVRGRSEAEQVKFYRIWPNSTLQHLSSKNFPDLEALRVSRKLLINMTASAFEAAPPIVSTLEVDEAQDFHGLTSNSKQRQPRAGLYLPALVLLIVIFADGLSTRFMGQSFLTVAQSILALGVAVLLTIPSAIRYHRGLV